MMIHSPLGPILNEFSPMSPSFSPSGSTEDPGLGIRCAEWAPGGRWIAVGGWDGRIRIVESEGGRCFANMGWSAKTTEPYTVSRKDWLPTPC
jgi:hypothetical protein